MATWFAQNGAPANIDAVSGGTTSNVWNAAANGSGAWMDISVLTAGAADTVLVANAKTVTVNIDIDIGATGILTNTNTYGGTAGGTFGIADARTVTADGAGGASAYLLTITGGTYALTLNGEYTAGGTYVIRNQATACSVTISGVVTCSSGYALYNSGTGTFTLNGGINITSTGCLLYASSTGGITFGGGNLIVTSGRLINNVPITCGIGDSNYLELPTGAGNVKCAHEPDAGDVRSGVQVGSVTGTLAVGGVSPIGDGGLTG